MLRRVALAPFQRSRKHRDTQATLDDIAAVGEARCLDFLLKNRLAGLWYAAAKDSNLAPRLQASMRDGLKRQMFAAAAGYLQQEQVLRKVHQTLEGAGIRYVVFKGVANRQRCYAHPALRPADDIDVLIAPADRTRAISSLVAAGMSFHPYVENISHEASLSMAHTAIDLHWDVMRPGRLRSDITPELLSHRQQLATFWTLDDNAALFIALVHPAFTKYVSTPHATLVRLVELQRLIDRVDGDWDRTLDLVGRCGVQTAAWATLYWLDKMLDVTVPQQVWNALRPGIAKRGYLRLWIDQDLPTRLLHQQRLIKLAFTLPLHDRLGDAIRATKRLHQEKARAEAVTAELNCAATRQRASSTFSSRHTGA